MLKKNELINKITFILRTTKMDRTCRQQINEGIRDLNHTMNYLDLRDISRTLHPTMAEYIFFLNEYQTLSSKHYVLGHKTIHSESKNLIIQYMFSNHDGIKLELNNRRKFGKLSNMPKLDNIILYN